MSESAKVSIIVPVHNTENYLKRCLDSIINQTYSNIEILCINDNSTDASFDILKEYLKKDDRFRIIEIKEYSVGAAEARNKALEVMTGDYVYFVDSDDWIDKDYVEVMVHTIEETNADIVMNRSIMEERPDGSVKFVFGKDKEHPDNSFLDAKIAVTDIFCTIWSKIYKRKLFDKYNLRFPKELINAEDFFFHFVSLSYIEKIYIISGPSYHYFFREGSLTKMQRNKDIDHIKAFSRIYDYYYENNLLNAGMKIFHIMPFFSVDNEEKYLEYKKYFEKTKNYLYSHTDLYNEMDLFFAKNITETNTFEEYRSKFSASVMMSFLKRNMKKTRI